ncbi:MAG: hypothetical protein HY551_08035 [Elusimicrobia bacterium]|nr:hypothetical protein [Elusimicrobiota bacterium]
MMSNPIAYPPNGTCEDILCFLARAEERRQRLAGIKLPIKASWTRRILEPIGNAVGVACSRLMESCPAFIVRKTQDWTFRQVAGNGLIEFDPEEPVLGRARELCLDIERRAGRRPALLCLMSHPPVDERWLHLNVEMVRHVLLALAQVRGAAARPRMVVAVDSYALDMLGLVVESVYAGFMGTYHLGIDRLALRRAPASRFWIGSASWTRCPWRLLSLLRCGGEAGIVMGGGVPQTARTLYTMREFLWRLRRSRDEGVGPARALRELRRLSTDFIEFLHSGALSPEAHRNAWRLMEAWIAAQITGEWHAARGERSLDAYTGSVSSTVRAALQACAQAMGCGEAAWNEEWEALQEEFHRETPYRGRFFRVLARRLTAIGRPVLLLPLAHRFDPQVEPGDEAGGVSLRWGEPILLNEDADFDSIRTLAQGLARANFS